MQLDKTRIAIRERNFLDLLDFSLKVAWQHAVPLAVAFAAGVVPAMLLNWWLIGWMSEGPLASAARARYFWVMAQLVFLEAQLATAPMTLYLGRAVFLQGASLKAVLRDLWHMLAQLILCQGLLRLVVPALLLVWMVNPAGDVSPEEDISSVEVLLPLMALYVVVMRALRPYLNEIILLERNPLRSRRGKPTTIFRRSTTMHSPNAGDLMARWLGSAAIAVPLTVSICFFFWFVSGVFLNDWNWGWMMVHVAAPLSMWLVAGYFAVVRFLSYLDLRIRREGWEVELRLRAEAVRIASQLS